MFDKRSKETYPYIGVVLLLLIGVHYTGLLSGVENFLRALLITPFSGVHSFSVKTGTDYQFFKDKEAFMTAYSTCLTDAGNQAILSAQVKLLQKDNAELRKQLEFKQKQATQSIAADVVGNNLDGAEQTLVINQGSDAGVAPDQPVVVGDGILIGKIIKVEKNIAIVRLIDDNRSKIGSLVLNEENSQGVVEGGYGISLRMQFIPRNETVQVGQQIVTSGLEDKIPRGLLIGTIAVVENEAYQPFQQAILTPAVNLTKLTLVTVLTDVHK
jgi:rod shape-determining protein MreC